MAQALIKVEGSRKKGKATPVDHYVGKQVRQRRVSMELSQEQLSDALGITFQQLQKYERGLNRISASRLYELGKILEVPVNYFYDGLDEPVLMVAEDSPALYESEIIPSRDVFELARNFNKIRDLELRKKILDMVQTYAEESLSKEMLAKSK